MYLLQLHNDDGKDSRTLIYCTGDQSISLGSIVLNFTLVAGSHMPWLEVILQHRAMAPIWMHLKLGGRCRAPGSYAPLCFFVCLREVRECAFSNLHDELDTGTAGACDRLQAKDPALCGAPIDEQRFPFMLPTCWWKLGINSDHEGSL